MRSCIQPSVAHARLTPPSACRDVVATFSGRLKSSQILNRQASHLGSPCHKLHSSLDSQQRRQRAVAAAVAQPVPLVDFPTHQLLPGLPPATQFVIDRVIEDLLLPILFAWIVIKATDWMAHRAKKAQESMEQQGAASLAGELMVLWPIAMRAPTQVITLVVLATHLARNFLWAVDRWTHHFWVGDNQAIDRVLECLCSLLVPLDKLLVNLYSALVVAFVTWAIIRWKSLTLTYFLQQQAQEQALGKLPVKDLERLVLPLDGVSSWVMSAIGAITILHVFGVNLQPVLALGGVSSLVVGLATQTLLTNTVLGFNFFLSRPFVAGDVVQFQGPGNMVVAGVVDKVAPMRVLLRTEDGAVVSIPNKVVSDMIIYNRTKDTTSNGISDRVVLRQPLRLMIKVPHAAMAQLAELRAALQQRLAAAAKVVQFRGEPLVLGKFTDSGVNITAQGLLQLDYCHPDVQELLLALSSTSRQYGATLLTL